MTAARVFKIEPHHAELSLYVVRKLTTLGGAAAARREEGSFR
jgi:hypothetical protein